jgi:hypothetical protein
VCILSISTQAITEDDDQDVLALKAAIKQSISWQKYESFSTLLFAAQSGDSEAIRDLIRRGVDIDQADYDGRSALAMVGARHAVHAITTELSCLHLPSFT